MTADSFCDSDQAVRQETPSRRLSSSAETPFLELVRWYIARNQVVSGSLVESKIVPAVTETCLRHSAHCSRSRRSSRWASSCSQPGQTKPSGQRMRSAAAVHSSSVP